MFEYEKLDVYVTSLEFTRWVYESIKDIDKAHDQIKEKIINSSQSIPLYIALSSGKKSSSERNLELQKAYDALKECYTVIDILYTYGLITTNINKKGKDLLLSLSPMIEKIYQYYNVIKEESPEYSLT